MYRKNTAGQFIHFQGVDATTGGIKSGVTWTARRCIDGTFAAAGLTVTEDSTNGWYKAALTQADTNGNNIAFNFTGTGAVPQTVNIVTTAADPTDAVHFGLSALPNTACTTNASLLTSGTGTDQLSVTTGRIDIGKLLGTAWLTPGTAGTPDVNVKLWNALATVALPLIPTVAGRTLDCSVGGEAGLDWANIGSPTTSNGLTGTTISTTQAIASVSGAVGSVTGAVGSVTGAVGSVTGAVGSVTGAVGSVTGNVGGNVTGSVGSVVGLTASNLDATISSRLASASYTAPPTAAQNATAVLTTQMTESYATLHTVPTLAQIMFEMRGLQAAKSVGSTTLTVKKIDGSTTAETFTLDSATAPTSIARAT
jgi:hypothetical protein